MFDFIFQLKNMFENWVSVSFPKNGPLCIGHSAEQWPRVDNRKLSPPLSLYHSVSPRWNGNVPLPAVVTLQQTVKYIFGWDAGILSIVLSVWIRNITHVPVKPI